MIIRRIETNRIEIVDESGDAFITTVPENYPSAEAWLQSWLEEYTAHVQVELRTQISELEAELLDTQVELRTQISELEAELLDTQERAADLERQLEDK